MFNTKYQRKILIIFLLCDQINVGKVKRILKERSCQRKERQVDIQYICFFTEARGITHFF